VFSCPLTKDTASEFGISGPASLVVHQINGESVSVEVVPDVFVVTLTPTAQDFSGVMDKTCGEIDAAYRAGKTIAFKIYTDQNGGYIVSKNVRASYGAGTTNFGFALDALIGGVGLITAYTGGNPPSDQTTYSTAIYPLTPMT